MARYMGRNFEMFSLLFTAVLYVILSKFAQTSSEASPEPQQSLVAQAPIFPKDSPVFEFANGNLEGAMARIYKESNEFSFIMYYAHWDGNSRDVSVEFDKVARRLSHQVSFVSINCWWAHSSCRKRFNIQMYPALLVTVPTVRSGLQFTGVLQADEMTLFLENVLHPYTYIPNMESLYNLHAKRGALVVGYFDSSTFPTPPGLASFQKAAWLALEKDPIEPIAFAVVTNVHLARKLDLRWPRHIAYIRSLHSTLFYEPTHSRFQASSIVEWVYQYTEHVVQWLAPAGVKSTIMASQLGNQAAVVLFTPHNPRQGFNNHYYLLKEIALDYHNCNSSKHTQKLIDTIRRGRHVHQHGCPHASVPFVHDNGSLCNYCQTVALDITPASSHGRNVCQVCEQSSQTLSTSCAKYASAFRPYVGHASSSIMELFDGKVPSVTNACLHVNYYYSPYSYLQVCCSELPTDARHLDVQNYFHRDDMDLRDGSGRSCFESAQKTTESSRRAQRGSSFPHPGSFSGMACRTNRSVGFFAMRSEYFWLFAEQLGVKSKKNVNNNSRTALVIFDKKAEQQHVLEQDLTATAMKRFIVNYTLSNLTRHLRSSVYSVPPAVCGEKSTVCVQEVVSSTFQELVLDNRKDVLLLYYAPWCGFCSRMHHLYLSLAKIFQDSSNLLIARIDGDANDLPWHLTHSTYPTLLLFPAGHKEHSIRFPLTSSFNLPAMIQFVLQHTTLLP